jgi:hypothetical protein
MNKEKAVGRSIWIVKFGMIAFGYLALSMFQHTINPLNFHWLATVLFIVWTLIWLKAKVTQTKG